MNQIKEKKNKNINSDDYGSTENEYLLIINLGNYLYPIAHGEQQDMGIEVENENCKIISEIELDFNLINDFHVLKNDRVLFLLNHVDKPLAVIDLQ